MLLVQEPLFRKQADHAQHVYVCVCTHVHVHGHTGACAHPVSIYYDICMVCYDFKSSCSW